MNRPPQLIVGAKLPLRPMHVWAIRVRLQIERELRAAIGGTDPRVRDVHLELGDAYSRGVREMRLQQRRAQIRLTTGTLAAA